MTETGESFLGSNLAAMGGVLRACPGLEKALAAPPAGDVTVRETPEGPVVVSSGQCLDHPERPVAAAEAWARRALPPHRDVPLVVFGFGGGYHLEAVAAATTRPIVVVEPDVAVLHAALSRRDLAALLGRLAAVYAGPDAATHVRGVAADLLPRPQTQALHPALFAGVRAALSHRSAAAPRPRIGVLGPMQGGTLPMTAYVGRAIAALGHRVRTVDVGGFAAGFHLAEDLVKDGVRRVGVQNGYLEWLSKLVAESLDEAPVDVFVCMAQAPASQRLLADLRKKGVVTVLWFTEDYLRFRYWREFAPYYDFVFTIQDGACLDAIRAAGCPEVHYLPVACDPEIHAPVPLSDEERARWGSPVSFVGAGYHNRRQLFASLANLPFKIWGTEWPACRPFDRMVQEGGRRLTPEEYVKIFRATEVNINLHSSTERDGVDPSGDFVNPRTFELAAAGAFQLVDERSHLPACLEPGREVVTFSDADDLKRKIEYYLARPEERAEVAAAARERVLRDHTYVRRAEQMLEVVFSAKAAELRRREDGSNWRRVLARADRSPELGARWRAAFDRGDDPTLDALVADVTTGEGKLSDTEQKLLFLHHVRRQIILMRTEEAG